MIKTSVGAVMVLLLAGCAGNLVQSDSTVSAERAQAAAETAGAANTKRREKAENYSAGKKSKDDLHCVTYMPTGSHRKRTRCVTQAQREHEEDAARNSLDAATGPTLGVQRQ
ncbi:MAG: hypothetical protein AB8G16_08610 [Gammaproteobacteria bacterium]